MIDVITIGCRLNQAEGDVLRSHDFLSNQNTIIVNTCAVTQEAVRTSWKMIRRALISKSKNTQLIVTGCLATLEKPKMLEHAGVDKVITQDEKVKLIASSPISTNISLKRSRPILKIQDGCPNHCSFCIASIIRGKSKSISPQIVLNNIKNLVSLGYQEIVLTGLNLGAYGIDINSSLTELLKIIPDDSFRIRLSSIQPDTITNELLDLWRTKKLCRHLHIPLQSGDDHILQLMRRKYTVDDYCRLIDKITKKISGVNIGTDIIVGFPSEDEQSFNKTVKIVEQLPFGYLHVFPYSVRAGTAGAKLKDGVSSQIKKERVRILKTISATKQANFRNRFINSPMQVIVEEKNYGLTDNYIRLSLPQANNYQKGKINEILFCNP